MINFIRIFYFFIFFNFFTSCSEADDKENTVNDELPPVLDGWEEVWSDEFDGETLDLAKWNILRWRPAWVNNELQAYTNRDTNIFLEDGFLVIQGLIEPGYYDTDYNGNGYNADYTSGRINTDDKFSWKYGRFDIKAKLPKGRGSWPAIWMLGENISSVGWPDCGEIDIMEHVGFEDGNIHGSIHTKDYNHMINTQRTGSTIVSTATDSFHVYSLEWSPNYLRYLVDNQPFFFVYNDSDGDIAKWPFDAQHYLILNLAIGGDWGGVEGVDPSFFPMRMLVDYARVFKQSDNISDIQVTFQVDMKNTNVNGTGVWLSGGSISSGSPGGLAMNPADNESEIWNVTLNLPINSNFTFKFRNGYFPNSWIGGWETIHDECGIGQYNDRLVNVGSADTVLTALCFNECLPCD